MKKAKLITAISSIVTASAALPLAMLTSCGPKGEQTDYTEAQAVTPKQQTGNNSFKTYTAKLAEMPKDGKTKVKIVNASSSQDQMSLVAVDNNGFKASSEIEVVVPENLEVAVNVIMNEPPIDSSESSFELEYVYTDSTDKTKGEKLSNCKYSYDISNDYVDLSSKDTQYIPDVTPKASWTSRDEFAKEYVEAILTGSNPNSDILAQDLYYTVSKHVIEAKNKPQSSIGYLDPDAEVGLYLNDIALHPDGGIWLRINFRIKAKTFKPYAYNTFSDVDATFQLTLDTGYTITLQENCDANKAWKVSVGLKTPTQSKSSHGRFKGSLKHNGSKLKTYEGPVSYQDTSYDPTEPVQYAANFATGGMAWIFNSPSVTGTGLNFYTYYGRYVQDIAPMGTVTLNGVEYIFNNLQDSNICASDQTQKIVLFKKDDTSTSVQIDRAEFDGKIVFTDKLTEIPDYFLQYCSKFNSEIDFSAATTVETIGNYFMYDCSSFNKKINFSKMSNLTHIKDSFMGGCSKWNNGVDETSNESDEFIIPDSVQHLGSGFLASTGYAQNITIPSNVVSINSNFMCNMEKMNGKTVTLNCMYYPFPTSAQFDNSFSCYFNTQPSDYTIYIHIDSTDPNFNFTKLHTQYEDISWTETNKTVRKLAQVKSVTLTPDEEFFEDIPLSNYNSITITNDPKDPSLKTKASWKLDNVEIPADQKWAFDVPTSSGGTLSKEVIVKKGVAGETSFDVEFTDDEWAQIDDQTNITIQPDWICKTCPVIPQSDILTYLNVVNAETAVEEWDEETSIKIKVTKTENFKSGTAYIVAKKNPTVPLSSSRIENPSELGYTFNLEISKNQWYKIPYGEEIELHYEVDQ